MKDERLRVLGAVKAVRAVGGGVARVVVLGRQ